ncbi:MAG TPA: penicillin-binding protein 2 [Puia sp.]|nr:penicillin-binding protein 2 [Puia sp.]
MSVFNQSRSNVIRLIFIGMFVIIIAQLVNIQIISSKYKKLAEENALFAKRVYPTRGIIFDKNGKAILNNTVMYDLTVTPSQVKNIDTQYFCQLLGIDTSDFRDRVLDAKFKNGPFRPTTFEDLLPPDIYAKFEENIWRFPGFNLQERPVRIYPFNVAAHVMGYVGEVDSNIIKSYNYGYQLGDYVGRSGLEQFYEKELMGQRGIEFWIKDNKNRLVGRYENKSLDTPAVAGKNLHTFIDVRLQELAERLLANKVGSIVAIEPKTGGIIAMASSPDYDPNDLTGSEKQTNYGKLILDASSPLLNRAIKGLYQPGSTYKPLGALIGLDEGVITPSSGYDCHGAYLACSHPVKCEHKDPGHAANLRLAIAHSCNSFFCNTFRLTIDNPAYHSARKGLTKWKEYANAFGLGHRIGIDIPSENAGNIPDTSAYDKEYHHAWNSCSMVSMGIGQDKMLVTPLQIANAMCIVANKGYFYVPHFVKSIDGVDANDTILNRFTQKHEVLTHIPDDVYEVVANGMQDVVEYGTASAAKIPGINICAKTGTAENYRIIRGRRSKLKSHSVFVCFAPRENPKIAIAVVIENAGFGAAWAAPIGSLLLEKYLNDSIRTERFPLIDHIVGSNLMPRYLIIQQFIDDSSRAAFRARQTGDSTKWKKFTNPALRSVLLDTVNHVFVPALATNIQNIAADKPKNTIKIKDTNSISN